MQLERTTGEVDFVLYPSTLQFKQRLFRAGSQGPHI